MILTLRRLVVFHRCTCFLHQ